MTGVEFLAEAIQIFPSAKRVLLTAYTDIEAAIRAINDVGIHHRNCARGHRALARWGMALASFC